MKALVTAGLAALLLSIAGSTARASDIFYPPDYVRGVWLRIGFTTEARFTFGVSAESLPWTAGVELSPGSAVGLVRVFAGLKSNDVFTPVSCSAFVGFGAALAAGFGPGQPPHLGLRLGAHVRSMNMTNHIGTPLELGEGLSYAFSWLADAGHVHDFGIETGIFDAPHASCAGD
jgi:hypothetical protein